jgi:DNA-binding NarL/FixJ family response regulator
VADHPHQSDELRASLERVGEQAAALHALVQSALANSAAGPRAPVREVGQRTALRKLTEREYEVLVLVADGLPTEEIAHRLGIASATVRSHVQSILTRLGVCNRRQAVALLTGRLPSPTRARLRAARRVPATPRRPEGTSADCPRPQPIRLAAAAPPRQKTTVPKARASSSATRLTRREVQVLRCLAAGLGRSEIAERLYVSPHTARTHIQRVLTKLGVHSALGAMAVARDVGLAPVM